MSENKNTFINIKDEFEMREKRLKLVYKILYVIAAIWIALILNISKGILNVTTMPVYVFLLSGTSIMIIKIIKYALIELRCMKIKTEVNVELNKQADDRYDNIWSSFSIILPILALIMVFHIAIPQVFNVNLLLAIFFIYAIKDIIFTIIEIYGKRYSKRTDKILGIVGIFFDSMGLYSICSLCCMAVMKV